MSYVDIAKVEVKSRAMGRLLGLVDSAPLPPTKLPSRAEMLTLNRAELSSKSKADGLTISSDGNTKHLQLVGQQNSYYIVRPDEQMTDAAFWHNIRYASEQEIITIGLILKTVFLDVPSLVRDGAIDVGQALGENQQFGRTALWKKIKPWIMSARSELSEIIHCIDSGKGIDYADFRIKELRRKHKYNQFDDSCPLNDTEFTEKLKSDSYFTKYYYIFGVCSLLKRKHGQTDASLELDKQIYINLTRDMICRIVTGQPSDQIRSYHDLQPKRSRQNKRRNKDFAPAISEPQGEILPKRNSYHSLEETPFEPSDPVRDSQSRLKQNRPRYSEGSSYQDREHQYLTCQNGRNKPIYLIPFGKFFKAEQGDTIFAYTHPIDGSRNLVVVDERNREVTELKVGMRVKVIIR